MEKKENHGEQPVPVVDKNPCGKSRLNSDARISFITTHFHEFAWTEFLVRKLEETVPSDRIEEILIVDQDRKAASKERLTRLSNRVRVLQYPVSPKHFVLLGHDHPHVLNLAMLEPRGSIVALFDSDAHPIREGWLDHCIGLLDQYGAILAADPGAPSLTHPCFMMFKRESIRSGLDFDRDVFGKEQDTGRLIGVQLVESGISHYLALPQSCFSQLWGSLYVGCIYHHGHGSFHGAREQLVQQVHRHSAYFRDQVLRKKRYTLAWWIRLVLATIRTMPLAVRNRSSWLESRVVDVFCSVRRGKTGF